MSFDRDRVRDLFTLGFVKRQEDVIFVGPVGVAKTYLASALGHAACRAGHDVLFLRADHMLQGLHQARADHTTEKALRRLLASDVLIVDDFGLRRLDARQSSDFYEVVLERHRRASTIVTSNRAIDEWIPLFDDPVLAQSRPRPARPQRVPTRPPGRELSQAAAAPRRAPRRYAETETPAQEGA